MTKRYVPVEPTEFGAKMRTTRKSRGMTLAQLGATCGVNTTYVSQIERGEEFGNEAALRCFRDTLNIDVSLFDLHFYQWGRISEELQFTDLGWARARLKELRDVLTIFRARMQG